LRRRAKTPAAAAPNSSSIGGAGTSVPPFDVVVVELPELVEVDELLEVELDELTLPEVDELVDDEDDTLPEVELEEETLPEVLDEVDE
jgi:hypothetical protein